jgi:DNA-binding response OmpR family regulator
MTTILVVDDDPHIRELARTYLEREGLAVLEAGDGDDALVQFESHAVALVVLDLMMPRMDGWQLSRELRAAGDTPILMLTAKGETADKVAGFSLGADDYLVKPFDPDELVARVKALLRRYRIAVSQVVEIGAVRLDGLSHAARQGGQPVELPRREFDLLFHLGSYQGRTLTREQLIEQVWGYDFGGDERTVDVHVKRLRDRFPEDACRFRIKTIRGLGYRLEVLP